MSIALRYQITRAVPQEALDQIIQEAQQIAQERDWWCEPLAFYPAKQPSTLLSGHTKLFLVAYSASNGDYVEVDSAEDWFMAYRDLQFIIQTLASWSVQYDITWALELEDETIGEISGFGVDKSVTNYLNRFAARCESDPNCVNADSIAISISDKYRSRLD